MARRNLTLLEAKLALALSESVRHPCLFTTGGVDPMDITTVLLECSVQESGAVRVRLAETPRRRRPWAWLFVTEGHLQSSVGRAHLRLAKHLS